jgi:hypothetical protein
MVATMVACVATLGCDRGETLGKVYGKVTFQGHPVTEGLLVFSNRVKGVHMTTELSADGSYELQTARGFGLPLGDYEIAVSARVANPPMPGMPTPPPGSNTFSLIPKKYFRPETSGLRLTVVDGDNPFNIDIKRQ